MKIDYHGKCVEEGRDYRETYILYNPETETELAEYIVETLETMGYEVTEEEGYVSIVVSDKNEYQEIVDIYKEIKANNE